MSEVLIAVVDDDARVRNATSSLLRSMGYLTRTYRSAALLLKEEMDDIDCVLSDYQMPDMTGLELLVLLRDRDRPIPLVLMTAYSGGGVAGKADRMGAAGFIEKPIDEDALIEAITAALI